MIAEADSFFKEEYIEKLRDKFQKMTSVLSAHQIALWEYDIVTGECSFTDDYFRILGLKEVGIIFKDILSVCLSGGHCSLPECFLLYARF